MKNISDELSFGKKNCYLVLYRTLLLAILSMVSGLKIISTIEQVHSDVPFEFCGWLLLHGIRKNTFMAVSIMVHTNILVKLAGIKNNKDFCYLILYKVYISVGPK